MGRWDGLVIDEWRVTRATSITTHQSPPNHFFFAAGAALPAAGAVALPPALEAAAPLAPAAAAGAALPAAAGAAPAVVVAPGAAAPSAVSSFTALATAIFRCATFGRPNTLFFPSAHFSSSFSLSSRSARVSTLR